MEIGSKRTLAPALAIPADPALVNRLCVSSHWCSAAHGYGAAGAPGIATVLNAVPYRPGRPIAVDSETRLLHFCFTQFLQSSVFKSPYSLSPRTRLGEGHVLCFQLIDTFPSWMSPGSDPDLPSLVLL